MDNGFKLDPNSSAVEGLLEANAALFSLIEVVLPPDIVNTTTSVEKKATKKKVAKI